jgi:O-succinylbenzoic acid--CoA ligase
MTRLAGPPLAALDRAAIDRALSVDAAAAEAGARIALIAGGEALSYAALAARVAARARPAAVGPRVFVGAPVLDAALEVYAGAAAGAALAPLHPRWPEALRRERAAALAAAPAADGFALLHTSGTSGAPKLVALSRRAVTASAAASGAELGWRPDDRWLCALPLAHVGGLMILVRCLAARATVVLADDGGFEPRAFAERVLARRITLLSLVPTQLAALCDAGVVASPHLRRVVLGGAPLPDGLRARATAAGWPIVASYGMTETASMVALDGTPLPGVELEVGTDGRVAVRGPMVARDGWLDTADLGRVDGDRLVVLGRADDVVISGGENVHPAEVEAGLAAVPGVRAACAFGVPDPRWGQAIACALVTDGGVRPPGLAAAIAALPSFARPRLVALVDALASGPGGKLDRATTAARATPALEPLG